MNTIDYREELRKLYENTLSTRQGPTTAGIAFYEWCLEREAEYRKSKGFSQTTLITDKAVYEFVLNKEHSSGSGPELIMSNKDAIILITIVTLIAILLFAELIFGF